MRMNSILLATIGLAGLASSEELRTIHCYDGWPSEPERYTGPQGWKEGDPITAPDRDRRKNAAAGVKRDSEDADTMSSFSGHQINLGDFAVEGLNMSETVSSARAVASSAGNDTHSHRIVPSSDCCVFNWDCTMFLKYGDWSLSYAVDSVNERMSFCCLDVYERSCPNPQPGPPFEFKYPPACSNP
jgi:hypothetical protein